MLPLLTTTTLNLVNMLRQYAMKGSNLTGRLTYNHMFPGHVRLIIRGMETLYHAQVSSHLT